MEILPEVRSPYPDDEGLDLIAGTCSSRARDRPAGRC